MMGVDDTPTLHREARSRRRTRADDRDGDAELREAKLRKITNETELLEIQKSYYAQQLENSKKEGRVLDAKLAVIVPLRKL